MSILFLWLVYSVSPAAELYAKKMEIVRTTEGQVTFFRDSVRISDGETRITAGWARVSESQGVAVIGESVVIENPDGVVRADSCVYYLNEKRTELVGNVRVEQESILVFAPKLEYVISRHTVYARDGLVVQGRSRDFRLEGRQGDYDLSQDIGRVENRPRMIQVQDKDSVVVTASEMQWSARESRALAAGKVQVESGRAQLTCDSLLYLTSEDSGVAWGSPVVTDSSSRTTGCTVTIVVKHGSLDRVEIVGDAASRYRTEAGDQVEVAGTKIIVRMDNGEVGTIEVHELAYGRLVRPTGSGGG
ncbi:MAG: LptA/OstA family protein [candidate division WOR-3 bacterium]